MTIQTIWENLNKSADGTLSLDRTKSNELIGVGCKIPPIEDRFSLIRAYCKSRVISTIHSSISERCSALEVNAPNNRASTDILDRHFSRARSSSFVNSGDDFI